MQYTPHYNLNLPEGTDIVNPLVQDNPNYTAIDTALYNNKLRVVGGATHVKTGTNHAITLADSDINQFKFVATGDYATGDTFTVDGVTVTPRIADGSTIPNEAFKINSTVLCVLDGTVLNLINVDAVTGSSLNAALNTVIPVSGSNANGNYIKYPDGTMICTKNVTLSSLPVNTAWGSCFESALTSLGDFAEEFAAPPIVTITNHGTVGAWFEYLLNTSETSVGSVRLAAPVAIGAGTFNIAVIAVGRWM